MDKLSPDVQMKVIEHLIAQEQFHNDSANAGTFFALFFAFLFGCAIGWFLAFVSFKYGDQQ